MKNLSFSKHLDERHRMSTGRESILRRLKEAARIPSRLPSSPENLDERIRESLKAVTPGDGESLIEQFREELELVSGEFHRIDEPNEAVAILAEIMKQSGVDCIAVTGEEICQKISEGLIEKHPSIERIQALELSYPERKNRLASIPVALVEASYAIADTGSLVFPYDDTKTSLPHFLSDCIVAIVSQKDLVANQFELFEKMPSEKAKNMVFVTGPSRTADIEKVLILGAHGPRRLIVIMIHQ
jgi:L-lactate dehydrogenase complex protein LldG